MALLSIASLPLKRLPLLMSLLLVWAPVCIAEDNPQAPADTKLQIQGGIKGTAVPFTQGINYVATAAAVIKQEAEALIGEATRQDTVVVRGPNVLPGGVVIPPIGGPSGVMQLGEMPMRKKKVDRWVGDLEHNVLAMQGYVDGLIIPADQAQAAEPAYTALRAANQKAQEHLAQLKELTSSRGLSNKKIGREALAIYDAMTEIQRQQRVLSTTVHAPEGSFLEDARKRHLSQQPQNVLTTRTKTTSTTLSTNASTIGSTSSMTDTSSVTTTSTQRGDEQTSR